MQIRRTAAALTSAAALSVTGVAMATPAQAAPVIAGGLVNVQVVNVANNAEILSRNNVGIGVAAGIAANVCPNVVAQVGVIAQQVARAGEFTCTATASGQMVVIEQAQ